MNSDATHNRLKMQGKNGQHLLIENQLSRALHARRCAGPRAGSHPGQTPRGGTPARVRLPLAPTPCSILAMPEASK